METGYQKVEGRNKGKNRSGEMLRIKICSYDGIPNGELFLQETSVFPHISPGNAISDQSYP